MKNAISRILVLCAMTVSSFLFVGCATHGKQVTAAIGDGMKIPPPNYREDTVTSKPSMMESKPVQTVISQLQFKDTEGKVIKWSPDGKSAPTDTVRWWKQIENNSGLDTFVQNAGPGFLNTITQGWFTLKAKDKDIKHCKEGGCDKDAGGTVVNVLNQSNSESGAVSQQQQASEQSQGTARPRLSCRDNNTCVTAP
ncbi:MAG: hypothetical protein R3B53_01550 [Candidatus Paceibacterota bacterium]